MFWQSIILGTNLGESLKLKQKIHFKLNNARWLAHLVSRFACDARVIADASSSPPVSRVKLL